MADQDETVPEFENVADLMEILKLPIGTYTWADANEYRAAIDHRWTETVAETESPNLVAWDEDHATLARVLGSRGLDVTDPVTLLQITQHAELQWILMQQSIQSQPCYDTPHHLHHLDVAGTTFGYHLRAWTQEAGIVPPTPSDDAEAE